MPICDATFYVKLQGKVLEAFFAYGYGRLILSFVVAAAAA